VSVLYLPLPSSIGALSRSSTPRPRMGTACHIIADYATLPPAPQTPATSPSAPTTPSVTLATTHCGNLHLLLRRSLLQLPLPHLRPPTPCPDVVTSFSHYPGVPGMDLGSSPWSIDRFISCTSFLSICSDLICMQEHVRGEVRIIWSSMMVIIE
jgi:hypothetical protein